MDLQKIRATLIARKQNILGTIATKERLPGYITLKHGRVLPQLERAIEKTIDGTYGTCDDCGTTIPERRLASAQGATRCVPCQQTWELSLT